MLQAGRREQAISSLEEVRAVAGESGVRALDGACLGLAAVAGSAEKAIEPGLGVSSARRTPRSRGAWAGSSSATSSSRCATPSCTCADRATCGTWRTRDRPTMSTNARRQARGAVEDERADRDQDQ